MPRQDLLLETGARGGDGAVHIVGIGIGNRGDQIAGGRIDDVHMAVAGRVFHRLLMNSLRGAIFPVRRLEGRVISRER